MVELRFDDWSHVYAVITTATDKGFKLEDAVLRLILDLASARQPVATFQQWRLVYTVADSAAEYLAERA